MKRIDRAFVIVRTMSAYCRIRLIIVAINLAFIITMLFHPVLGGYSNYLYNFIYLRTIITMFESSLSILIYTFGIFTMFQFRSKLTIPAKIYWRLLV